MAWTQADLDTLDAAIATGALEVTFGAGPDQRTIRYRSLADMISTRALIEKAMAPGSAPPTRTVGGYNPGYGPLLYPPFWPWGCR